MSVPLPTNNPRSGRELPKADPKQGQWPVALIREKNWRRIKDAQVAVLLLFRTKEGREALSNAGYAVYKNDPKPGQTAQEKKALRIAAGKAYAEALKTHPGQFDYFMTVVADSDGPGLLKAFSYGYMGKFMVDLINRIATKESFTNDTLKKLVEKVGKLKVSEVLPIIRSSRAMNSDCFVTGMGREFWNRMALTNDGTVDELVAAGLKVTGKPIVGWRGPRGNLTPEQQKAHTDALAAIKPAVIENANPN